ncbi:hypothetical protein TNCV_371511 [Trichonephila clavipes]|nr:hypothetical protein TNCV_371511 [Trichonephila clavipes]
MRSYKCSIGFRSGELAGQRKMSNPVRLWKEVKGDWNLKIRLSSLLNQYGGYGPRLVTEGVRVQIPSKTWLYLLRERSRSFTCNGFPSRKKQQRTSSCYMLGSLSVNVYILLL